MATISAKRGAAFRAGGHRDAAVLLAKLRDRSLKIVVLAGGPGAERQVSLHSGQAVFDAFRRQGFETIVRDITPDDLTALDVDADFFFVALHGDFGEDGGVQTELERRRLFYSGSGSQASRLAMNKVDTKRGIEGLAIPTPSWCVVNASNVNAVASFATPAVVKPVASGSSVDLTIARSVQALSAACQRLVQRYGEALVESYVRGRELTVGVLGTQALPVCEIRTKREFYDYQAKYIDDDTEYLFDVDLPEKLTRRIQELSRRVHEGIGCRVFSRIDWMIDAGTLEPFFLEINTIPGFTSHSLVPKAAARLGISFEQLCCRIIELSLSSDTSG